MSNFSLELAKSEDQSKTKMEDPLIVHTVMLHHYITQYEFLFYLEIYLFNE